MRVRVRVWEAASRLALGLKVIAAPWGQGLASHPGLLGLRRLGNARVRWRRVSIRVGTCCGGWLCGAVCATSVRTRPSSRSLLRRRLSPVRISLQGARDAGQPRVPLVHHDRHGAGRAADAAGGGPPRGFAVPLAVPPRPAHHEAAAHRAVSAALGFLGPQHGGGDWWVLPWRVRHIVTI